mgnify:FL=1
MNLEIAKDKFKNYAQQFKVADNKVNIKITHTMGVVKASEYIARRLNLTEEDVELAELIGLLHDIGRFEQAVTYDNYDDYDTIDHAELGVEVLFRDGFIREFIDTDKYDNIIKEAIRNHNKYEIEEGLDERELLFAKIIRDADKTDNFEVKQYQDFESLFKASEQEVQEEKITDDIWNVFLQEKTIISSQRVTNMDKWLSYLAWVYDYNFASSLQYLKENDCINKVIDRIDYKDETTKERMECAREKLNRYINEKLANN